MTASPTTNQPLQVTGFRKWERPWRQRWQQTRKNWELRKDTKRSVCVVYLLVDHLPQENQIKCLPLCMSGIGTFEETHEQCQIMRMSGLWRFITENCSVKLGQWLKVSVGLDFRVSFGRQLVIKPSFRLIFGNDNTSKLVHETANRHTCKCILHDKKCGLGVLCL